MKKIYKGLPDTIKNILLISEGWLVGGAVKSLLNDEAPRDYDIIVPSRELFQIACAHIKSSKEVVHFDFNTFGGFKFKTSEYEVDFWCEELSHFIVTARKFSYAYNMKRAKLIANYE